MGRLAKRSTLPSLALAGTVPSVDPANSVMATCFVSDVQRTLHCKEENVVHAWLSRAIEAQLSSLFFPLRAYLSTVGGNGEDGCYSHSKSRACTCVQVSA